MARQIVNWRKVFHRSHCELLWKLTDRRPKTLPADNLDDPAVHLLGLGLAEVVDGRLQATQAGHDLRNAIEREQR